MPHPTLKPGVFAREGRVLYGQRPGRDNLHLEQRFRALFGVTPEVCSSVRNKLLYRLPNGSEPKHLLWCLLFLKVYASEHVNATVTGSDEKTFRKWAWTFVGLLADLEVINWSNRLRARESSIYKVSVDGTDLPIYEPAPFDPKWYSHKFRGPGLRYEVGVAIATGRIVWIFGPFPGGSFTDLKIFRLRMKRCLLSGEKVVADGGYNDERCSASPNNAELKYWSYVRARHEAVNKRLKQFNVLKHRFRHRLL